MPGDASWIAGWPEANASAPAGAMLPRNNLFYSFNVGGAHVAIVSSEHDLTAGSTQVMRDGGMDGWMMVMDDMDDDDAGEVA